MCRKFVREAKRLLSLLIEAHQCQNSRKQGNDLTRLLLDPYDRNVCYLSLHLC